MKLLKRKTLFALASETDFFSPRVDFDYYGYKFLYDRLFNYQPSSIRDACLQLVQSGELDKISRNRIAYFRLTARGREQLLSFFPQSVGQKKVWDKTWRIALIKDSRKLRVILRRMGFRKLARGVYITPLPISAKIKDLLLSGKFSAKIAVIESRRLILGDDQQLAKQIWPLGELQQGYQNLIRESKALLTKIKSQEQLSDEVKKQFSLILNNYFSLLEQDPGLPKKLLLDDWPALEAQKLLLKLAFCFHPNL